LRFWGPLSVDFRFERELLEDVELDAIVDDASEEVWYDSDAEAAKQRQFRGG
jgi:hypothetical protein